MIKLLREKPVSVGIVGTGVCLPEKILTNRDLEKMVDTSDEWIITRTGIRERRITEKSRSTSDLAAEAGAMALKNANIMPEEVDLIIVATITPDMFFPSTSCLVQDKLGASRASAFDISAGCSGFIYAMTAGTQFISTGMYNTVLVIGAEVLSRIINWEDRSTCVLFGDGAGAAVLRRVEDGFGILSVELGADGSNSEVLKIEAGAIRMPITENNCHNPERYLYMAGSEVFKFAVRIIGDSTLEALDKAGLKRKDINCFIPHQANIRIIQAAARRLNVSMDKVFVNVQKYGNTSAASIPVALHEAIEEGRIKKGDNVVLVGFGAGLTWGASVVKWAV
ncbi:MAG: 3-oxoacyl-ACP synthase [Firmicutes bacterium HGW-Firmicutes-14]|nr:MAG: 3-oxoacyl-ACP synthase [Firmicutes bacterium HGW-Firmicutes-14]